MSTKGTYDYLFKIILVGDVGVGKPQLVLRFADPAFETTFIPTIGIDFKIRNIEVDGKRIKLQMWDTAGQERFMSITTSYYRGAMGVIVVYDVTNQNSFDNVAKWFHHITSYANENVTMLLVGNKCDLASQRQVAYSTAKEYADQLGISFFETSAKEGTNCDEALMNFAAEIKNKMDSVTTTSDSDDPGVDIDSSRNPDPVIAKKSRCS